jgi:uncharacterized protein UPF0158
MTRTTVKYKVILDTFDFVSFGQPMEHEAYLCKETGEIYWHSEYGDDEEPLPDDINDPEKYIVIPHKNDLDLGKSLVLKFAGEFLPEIFGKVEEIFSRAGAYARFKDLLEHRGMLEQWYEYEAKTCEQVLREWCEDNGVEIDD